MAFGSDNTSGLCVEVLESVLQADQECLSAESYGNDIITARMKQKIRALFDHDDLECYMVPTGTAANCLAISHLAAVSDSAGGSGIVLCADTSHVLHEECGAAEFFGCGTLSLRGVGTAAGKIRREDFQSFINEHNSYKGFRSMLKPKVLSFANVTELGTVYTPEETASICELARQHGILTHLDGSRLSNAVSCLNCPVRKITWEAGVDAVSFGLTKLGALQAELVIFFSPQLAVDFAARQRRSGHLLSKHRYMSCQVLALMNDGVWLKYAHKANTVAAKLAGVLNAAGFPPLYPVEANEVFVILPSEVVALLDDGQVCFYVLRDFRRANNAADERGGCEEAHLVRFVTSFSSTDAEVESVHKLLTQRRPSSVEKDTDFAVVQKH